MTLKQRRRVSEKSCHWVHLQRVRCQWVIPLLGHGGLEDSNGMHLSSKGRKRQTLFSVLTAPADKQPRNTSQPKKHLAPVQPVLTWLHHYTIIYTVYVLGYCSSRLPIATTCLPTFGDAMAVHMTSFTFHVLMRFCIACMVQISLQTTSNHRGRWPTIAPPRFRASFLGAPTRSLRSEPRPPSSKRCLER